MLFHYYCRMNMSTANNSSLIVDQLITYADWFFPGEMDFDRDLEVGILNDSENQTVGMRRCASNTSLSDHGESPPQGSPKPAARRKNKPAPTPPSGNTPDKHDKNYDDKQPPPTPDKPPRALALATLTRTTHKVQKHEINAESTREHEDSADRHTRKHTETDTKTVSDSTSTDLHPADNPEQPQEISAHQNEVFNSSDVEKSFQELQRYDAKVNASSVKEKPCGSSSDNIVKSIMDSEHNEATVQKPKPVPTEKPSTLERRRPVAAPRNITNIAHSAGKICLYIHTLSSTYQFSFYYGINISTYMYIIAEEGVELRKKLDNSITNVQSSISERGSKPAIPERPAGLVRPSSLIRQRQSNENLETDPGVSKKDLKQ